jgi:hypothetical protein
MGPLISIGANVNETWFAMAAAFYASAEYAALGRDTTGFVRDLYRTFFNRDADDDGLAYWVGLVGSGLPREIVLTSFMFSPEFVGFTARLFGNTSARAEVDMVMDFYRGLLGRTPDYNGFNAWIARFRSAQCAGEAAVVAEVDAISKAFVTSPEYAARNRSDTLYVADLYNAFLRRGGDRDGVSYWIGRVGVYLREDARRAFVASPEFQARVKAVIAQGCS